MDPMNRKATVGAVTAAAVLVVGAGGLWWRHTQQEQEADRAASAEITTFAKAWQSRKFADPALTVAGTTPQVLGAAFTTATSGLGSGPLSVRPGEIRRSGDTAMSTLHV